MKNLELPVSQIYIGKRFREDYGDIKQLKYSIEKNGLITPIAVGLTSKITPKQPTDLPYILLAGGRRIHAVTELGWSTVPVRIFDSALSELDYRSIELAENFDRKSMSYVEELALMREINELQMSIHGQKISKSPDAPGWSQADTARLLSKSTSTVANDLKLAKAIKEHPELELDKCKNKSEALKKLRRLSKTIQNSILAEKYSKDRSKNIVNNLSKNYIISDCLSVIRNLKSSSIDLVEVDPPYAINLNSLKKESINRTYKEFSSEDYLTIIPELLEECFRVLKNNSWLIFWFGPNPWFTATLQMIRDKGFSCTGIPAIWVKPTGQSFNPRTSLANNYEMFFFAKKGKPQLNLEGHGNTFQCTGDSGLVKIHPTQKPISLMREIYSTFLKPNSSIYIPFLGSGVGIIAAHLNNMKAFGTDLDPQYKDNFIIKLSEVIEELEKSN